MNRIPSLALLAGLLAALAPGVADADTITYSSTSFSGQSTDLTTVGYVYSLPYTDSYGNNINGGANDAIYGSSGLQLSPPTFSSYTDTLTLTLAAPTTEVGFSFLPYGSTSDYLASATFSNGSYTDTFTGGSSYQPDTIAFMGFTDDRSFNQVTLNFVFGSPYNGESMSGYTTLVPASVPEPSSLAMCGLAGLIGSAYAWRRRQRAAIA